MQHLGSRKALAAASAELGTVVDGLDQDGRQQLADQLWQIAGVLDTQPALRRTLADGTTAAAKRIHLAEQVFGRHIAEAAASVLGAVVRASWSNSADLRDGLRILSQTALLRSAERAGNLDAIEDELFRFERICDGNPELARSLDDPTKPAAAKQALLGQLLSGKADPITLRLLGQLVTGTSVRSFASGVRDLIALAASRADKIVAIARVAKPMSASQTERLQASLTRIYGQPVVLHVAVQPGLLAGMTVTVGDEVIDGSVSGRFDRLRRDLAG